MSPISCLLRLGSRLTSRSSIEPVLVRHRASGWFVALDGATDDPDEAVRFESEGHALEFVDAYTCEPPGFEVVPADEVAAAA
jgi:hypothetical protein